MSNYVKASLKVVGYMTMVVSCHKISWNLTYIQGSITSWLTVDLEVVF